MQELQGFTKGKINEDPRALEKNEPQEHTPLLFSPGCLFVAK